MTAPLRVSVALGTHNGERFIGEQIESILAQSRPVDEIVLSDDASADATVARVQHAVAAFAAAGGRAPELVVLRNEPALGVTANFEQALRHCSGELIALCDQDDVWHPARIERLVAQFRDPRVLLVFSNARQVDAEGAPLGHELFDALAMSRHERALVTDGRAFEQFMRRNLATGATVMVRRPLVEASVPFPGSWLHDEWLAVVAAAFDGVQLLDECLTDYRQHGANQVGMDKLGLRRKLAMFAQPRTERNLRLFQRASALSERIDGLRSPHDGREVPSPYREMAHEKARFEQARQRFPRARALRLVPVLRQLVRGRYARYGTGLKDAVRNLLQPV